MVECVVINCMDGHLQLPIISYANKHFGALHTWFLRVAKPSYLIAENRGSRPAKYLLQNLSVLMLENKPKTIVLVAHHNHADETETERMQLEHLNDAVQFLARFYRSVEVLGLWMDAHGTIQETTRSAAFKKRRSRKDQIDVKQFYGIHSDGQYE